MLNLFKEYIQNNLPFLQKSKILIAISGGLDSVVLTHLCHQLKLNISLVHCNFNLRGNESDGDEEFVLSLAEDWDLEVFVDSFDTETYANENKLSTQMAARELRYNWFTELAEQLHFNYVLTAHHADDNLETFLINSLRGTGLDGLLGIPEVNNIFVRPLLPFSREDILDYATANNLKWRDDSSNASTKYLRNKLRHDVVPFLKEINPQLLQSLSKTQNHLQDSKIIIEDSMARIQKKVVSIEEDNILIDIKKVQKLSDPKVYLYELLKDFGFTEWDDVAGILNGQSGKLIQSRSHRLIRDRKHLIVTELPSESNFESIQINDENDIVVLPMGNLSFEEVNKISTKGLSSIYVDKDLLKYPLTVRKWEKGDYFYPFGMTGKKKLSKFFKDEKWSLPQKEEALLLVSNDNKIIWIINSRMDDRFKLTNNTNQILKISFQNET
ncbi:tRNA lysidine(34) synthetase TilS [Hanstruepera neustonica]|uniref:tRNA(Ile)-lysidine synthase n=1 Tax=Hanstruepera neustonica TaxID=1445657 RepID=A0A2K1DXW5_9FLAO|nr:tRNA lysidine(34) synthetase TilS [Hanstruepera neustonica]PNQ72868.1 tRNA lysidine(34) synthetase TilS [Hanstruepera neustonica]